MEQESEQSLQVILQAPPELTSLYGTRYQEDRTAICTLGLSPAELELTYQKHGIDWSPKAVSWSFAKLFGRADLNRVSQLLERGPSGEELAGQVGYFGIFDGYVHFHFFSNVGTCV